MRNYKEGVITFSPTYKYLIKTNEFDWNRSPAYCDRILFESVHDLPQKNPIMNIYYGKVDYNLSDHKPITGLFEAKIKVIDGNLKNKVIEKITQKFLDQGQESESERKEKFLKYLERSSNEV